MAPTDPAVGLKPVARPAGGPFPRGEAGALLPTAGSSCRPGAHRRLLLYLPLASPAAAGACPRWPPRREGSEAAETPREAEAASPGEERARGHCGRERRTVGCTTARRPRGGDSGGATARYRGAVTGGRRRSTGSGTAWPPGGRGRSAKTTSPSMHRREHGADRRKPCVGRLHLPACPSGNKMAQACAGTAGAGVSREGAAFPAREKRRVQEGDRGRARG